VLLNVLQTLNGLACFSQTFTISEFSASNVVSLSAPYGSSNVDLQGFCRGGRIKQYDDNQPLGYVTNCTIGHGQFSCFSRSTESKPRKEVNYGCNCLAGSKSFDPINMVITRENVFQTFNGSMADHSVQCNASVIVGQCSLNKPFYTVFLAASASAILVLLLISFLTNLNKRSFEDILLTFGQSTKTFQKYGFIDYCDWSSGGRSYCSKGEGYEFVDRVFDGVFVPSFSTTKGFYEMKKINGSDSKYIVNLFVGPYEKRFNVDLDAANAAMLSICLKLIVKGKKIHEGDHFLSVSEIVAKCKEGKKLSKSRFEGPLYGTVSLFDKLMFHSKCFFGFFRRDAVNQVLKHNIRNPCPCEIKSSEWKMYLSDVNFHMGYRRSSKLKRFEPSKGFIEYSANVSDLKPNSTIMLNEKESEIIENNVVEESLSRELKANVKSKLEVIDKAKEEPKDDNQTETGWVKNYDDLKPVIYSSSSSEVLANKDNFVIYGDEAVKRRDGYFNFKKSYLEVLKEDDKKGFVNIRGGGILERVPYKHKNLEYKRICSHGLVTENLQHLKKLSHCQSIDYAVKEIKANIPLVKKVVYGNYKEKDIPDAKRLKKVLVDTIELSPNPFELTDSAPELNYFLRKYSLGGENDSLFFFPSKGETVKNFCKLDLLKENIKHVEELVSTGCSSELKKRKKNPVKWKKKKKRGKKKPQGKKEKKYDHIHYQFEDERPDIKRVSKTCLKKSNELDKLYDKSLTFCKKLNSHILKEAEAGKPLLSANNMKYRGVRFKQFGLSNRILGSLYKGCNENEPCRYLDYCMNQENAKSCSLLLDRAYDCGYTEGNSVLGFKTIIERHFAEIFFGKIDLDRFLRIEI
jgi:hypothetical protein